MSLEARIIALAQSIGADMKALISGKVDKSGAVTSVAGRTGAVTLAKGDVGLGNADNTSDATKLTQMRALGLGASGVNLLPYEMSVFGPSAPDVTTTGGATKVTVSDTAAFKGYALQTSWSTATGQALLLAKDYTLASCNMTFKRQKYLLSFWAKADVVGHQVGGYLRLYQADNTTTITGPAPFVALTDTWTRYSLLIDMTSATYTGTRMSLVLQQNRTGVAGRTVWFDRIMVEPVVNDVEDPSVFVSGATSYQPAPVINPAFTGDISLSKNGAAAASALTITGDAGYARNLSFKTVNSGRWDILANEAAESGANAGSDLVIVARTDAGAYLRTPLSISRATGEVTVGALNSNTSLKGASLEVSGNTVLRSTIELGATNGVATPTYIDFHSGAVATDRDSRILSSGGTGSNDGATLQLSAGTVNLVGTGIGLLGATTCTQPLRTGSFTLTTLPSAASFPNYLIIVSNATGGAKLCYSNGTNWMIINTNTIVS